MTTKTRERTVTKTIQGVVPATTPKQTSNFKALALAALAGLATYAYMSGEEVDEQEPTPEEQLKATINKLETLEEYLQTLPEYISYQLLSEPDDEELHICELAMTADDGSVLFYDVEFRKGATIDEQTLAIEQGWSILKAKVEEYNLTYTFAIYLEDTAEDAVLDSDHWADYTINTSNVGDGYTNLKVSLIDGDARVYKVDISFKPGDDAIESIIKSWVSTKRQQSINDKAFYKLHLPIEHIWDEPDLDAALSLFGAN